MSAAAKTYGTAPEAGAAADQEYDIDNTYYVKEREMSRKERITKFVLLALPILLALLLVGGFAFYVISHVLERGGGHKNIQVTSPSGTSSSGGGREGSRPGTYPSGPQPAHAPKVKSHTSSNSADCSENTKCADLGLIGACCPTKAGVTLGCCD